MRIEVRRWRETDAEALERAILASLDHLRPWMAFVADEPKTLAQRRRWITDSIEARDDLLFGIFAGDEVAGGCGLHRRIGAGGLEIGYWLHPRCTGRGVATGAVHELCATAFADPAIDHVEIHHDAANAASEGVPRRAGFIHVEDRPEAPQAPADSGVERVWRLRREQWLSGRGRAAPNARRPRRDRP